jgi:hypothetical protein
MQREYSTTLSVEEFVKTRAKDLINNGCDGLISSPKEVTLIRDALPNKKFLIVTPGIRPAGTSRDDQKRIATPYDAIKNGADYLVVGRPITQSDNPENAARRIIEDMELGFEARTEAKKLGSVASSRRNQRLSGSASPAPLSGQLGYRSARDDDLRAKPLPARNGSDTGRRRGDDGRFRRAASG